MQQQGTHFKDASATTVIINGIHYTMLYPNRCPVSTQTYDRRSMWAVAQLCRLLHQTELPLPDAPLHMQPEHLQHSSDNNGDQTHDETNQQANLDVNDDS